MKIYHGVKKLRSGHDFHTEKHKGHNSVNNVGGVTILVFCMSSDYVLYL